MLYWIYIVILAAISYAAIRELFDEKDWKKQIGYVMVLVPFILRILQVK